MLAKLKVAIEWANLLVLGAFVIFLAVTEFAALFGESVLAKIGIEQSDLILVGVSLIIVTLIALLIDDRITSKRQLQELKNLLQSREAALVSIGEKDSWKDSLKFALTAEQKIETIIWGGPKAPDFWIRDLRVHMKKRAEAGKPVLYEVVLMVPHEVALSQQFLEANKMRLDVFRKDGLDLRVSVLEMEKTLGLDLMIVDSEHLFIGVSHAIGFERTVAVTLANHQQAARIFSAWFERVSRLASPIERYL